MSPVTVAVVIVLGVLLGLGWTHVAETVRAQGDSFRRPLSWLAELPCAVRNGGHVWTRYAFRGASTFIACSQCNAEPGAWRRQAPALARPDRPRPYWRRAVAPVAVAALTGFAFLLMTGCTPPPSEPTPVTVTTTTEGVTLCIGCIHPIPWPSTSTTTTSEAP